MNLILIVLAALYACGAAEDSNVFYTGFMEFTQDDTSEFHEIGKVNKPISILSMSSLAYSNSFAMRTTRKLFKRKKQYLFQVNVTAVRNHDAYFAFSVTIQYIITRQLANVQVFTLNLTTKKPTATVKPDRLSIIKSRCIVFPLGFTNSSLTNKFTIRQTQGPKYLIYAQAMVNHTGPFAWVQVQVVVVQEKFTICGPINIYESDLNLNNAYYDNTKPETKPEFINEPILKIPGY